MIRKFMWLNEVLYLMRKNIFNINFYFYQFLCFFIRVKGGEMKHVAKWITKFSKLFVIYFFSSISLPWIVSEARQLSIMIKDFNLRLNLGKSRNISIFTRLLISLIWIPPFFIDESMKIFQLPSLANSNNYYQLPKK